MVSFQCDGCSDVVKKPKLDQHHSRCYASFTCIDCSTTFNGPAHWKGHTQCVTEAEKYQKSLYKGPKTGQQNHSHQDHNQHLGTNTPKETNGASVPSTGKYPQPRLHTRPTTFGGPRGGGAPGPGWGRPRYCATGANDTPLGTPVRMQSPPPPATSVPETPTHTTSNNTTINGNGATATSKPVDPPKAKEEKKDKKKKRKSDALDGASDGPTETTLTSISANPEEPKAKKSKKKHDTPFDIASVSLQPSLPLPAKDGEPNEKARKKKEKKGERKSLTNGDGVDVHGEETTEERKSKSKQREKDIRVDGDVKEALDEREKKSKKKSKKDKEVDEMDVDGVPQNDEGGKKKRKRSDEVVSEVGGVVLEEKKKKKHREGNGADTLEGSRELPITSTKAAGKKEKKEKKSKVAPTGFGVI